MTKGESTRKTATNHDRKTIPALPFFLLKVTTLLLVSASWATAATIDVTVAPGGALIFSPNIVTIQPGDTVKWTWQDPHHSVTSGIPGASTGLFDSGIQNSGATFSFTFTDP